MMVFGKYDGATGRLYVRDGSKLEDMASYAISPQNDYIEMQINIIDRLACDARIGREEAAEMYVQKYATLFHLFYFSQERTGARGMLHFYKTRVEQGLTSLRNQG